MVLQGRPQLDRARALPAPGSGVNAVAFSRDGGALYAGTTNGALLRYELGSDAAPVPLVQHGFGINELVVGPGCEGYVEGFGEGAESCRGHDEAVARLLADSQRPLTVLVKGSRSSAMDCVVEGIKEKVNT